MIKKSIILFLSILLLQSNLFSQLILNEVLSSNGTTIADNVGEFDDWIEIYNSSNMAIDLAGYFISDDVLDLTSYEILADDATLTTVPANGYLLLWADKDEEQGANHVGVKLSAGETVILTKPDGSTVVDSLSIPSIILEDESFGSETDGGADRKLFSQATPLTSNANSNDVDIEFSESSKLFTNSITISLTTDGSNGVLKYTTNGEEPTINSITYTNALNINNNTILKVAYFFNNGDISSTVTERYVKMTNGMANANSDLPIIIIDTYGQTLDEENKKTSFMSVIEPNNNDRAYGSDEASFSGKAGIKIRGASSATFAKKQWRVELRNEDDTDRKESLLGMPADGDWVLYAPGQYDKALINNALMYEVSNQLGYYAPRTRFVEVYFNDNGGDLSNNDYWGIYILTEKIEVNNDRVDIAKLEPEENSGEDLTGGYLFSLDRDRAFETAYTNNLYGNWNVPGYRIRTPDIDDITPSQLSYINDEIIKFETALTNPNWLDENQGYKNFTDIESWVGPHIIRALAKEPDGFFLSHYIIKDKNEVIKAGPVWDFDRALNSPDSRSQNYFGWDTDHLNNPNTGNVNYWTGNYKAGAYIKEMVNDPCYKNMFYDKWFDWRSNNILNTTKMNALIDSLAGELTESYQREFNRWSGQGYTPRYGSFQGEVDELKKWLKKRSEWIDGELINPVTANPNGGTVNIGSTVTLNNPNNSGTIYYTIDGSDPKQNCSSIATSAIAYNGAISINSKGITFIKTRTKQGNEWGALATHRFYVEQDYAGLVINEIHYNPQDEVFNNETIDGTNFEFIELKNIGSTDINIAGIVFEAGIETDIQAQIIITPGNYVVIAENHENFQQKYGFVPDAIYSGKLSNKGEEIILNDPLGAKLDELEYDDAPPWDEVADEGLYSLGLIDATADNSDGSNWAVQSIYTTPKAGNIFCFTLDSDGDGICDNVDQCPNEDDTIIGKSCDDGDSCTTNDIFNSSCNCEGVFIDTDNDGVCDVDDICNGWNDNLDADSDGKPDDCDACPNEPTDNCDLTNCNAQSTDTNYEFIQSVTINGQSNISSNNNGYGNFTGTTLAQLNDSNEIILIAGFTNSTYPENWNVWIDFNNDGNFDNINELVLTGTSSGTAPLTGSFNAPSGIGTIIMRVAMRWNVNPESCGSFQYGEVEDYKVRLTTPCAPGTTCDDGDACTAGETYNNNCNCAGGTLIDTDVDGVCDLDDQCPDLDDGIIGTACDDNDPCTTGDVYNNACNCSGNFADADSDGVCDIDDVCASGNDSADIDGDGTPDACDTCNNNLTNTVCDDGDVCTIGETYDANCNCIGGTVTDIDEDGLCDANDDCIGFDNGLIGTSCDDNDPCTIGDVYNNACACSGTFADDDEDGICNNDDICENGDDNADVDADGIPDGCDLCNGNLNGTPCDDGDACTTGETFDVNCNCVGTFIADADADGVCDVDDVCPNGDDSIDSDGDNIPNECDDCPNDSNNVCSLPTYCTSKGNNVSYEYISNVSVGPINNTTGANGGYGDYTNIIGNVVLGNTIPVNLQTSYPGSAYPENWKIWIDFNQDGDFDDAEEEVFSGNGTGSVTGSITIPNNASLGATGMRVSMVWNATPPTCGTFTYGEVEDYTIAISTIAGRFNGLPTIDKESLKATHQKIVKIYPNPVNNNVNIDLLSFFRDIDKTQQAAVKIFSTDGKLLVDKNILIDAILKVGVQELQSNQYYFISVKINEIDLLSSKFLKR